MAEAPKRQIPTASSGREPGSRRKARVGIFVPNLFLFVPVETAVTSAGAVAVALPDPEAVRGEKCKVLVVDLEPLGEKAADRLAPLCRDSVVVLAFGPHVEGENLTAARAAGAVALPRSAFFARLPELLQRALATAGAQRRRE